MSPSDGIVPARKVRLDRPVSTSLTLTVSDLTAMNAVVDASTNLLAPSGTQCARLRQPSTQEEYPMNHGKCSGCQNIPPYSLTKIDDPSGWFVCLNCLGQSWRCTRCGKRTLVQFDMDVNRGAPPVDTFMWCLACCLERLGECERCCERNDIETLFATEIGLFCRFCVATPARLECSKLPVTRENWQEIVMAAIDTLPGPVASLVGHQRISSRRLSLITEDKESPNNRGVGPAVHTYFIWWESRRKEVEQRVRDRPPSICQETAAFEATLPMYEEPTIAVLPGAGSPPYLRFNPTRCSAHDLTQLVHTVMLHVLTQCGRSTTSC